MPPRRSSSSTSSSLASSRRRVRISAAKRSRACPSRRPVRSVRAVVGSASKNPRRPRPVGAVSTIGGFHVSDRPPHHRRHRWTHRHGRRRVQSRRDGRSPRRPLVPVTSPGVAGRSRSAPSMSALLTTNTSPISRMPALSICTSSPLPGGRARRRYRRCGRRRPRFALRRPSRR